MGYENWRLDTDADGVAWLCIDKPESSANTLSADVLRELNEALEQLEAALPKGLVVYSGKDQGFIMNPRVTGPTGSRRSERFVLPERSPGGCSIEVTGMTPNWLLHKKISSAVDRA